MMGDSYCPFPERLSAQFTEIDSDVMMSLSESNPEYAADRKSVCRERV